MTAGLILLRVSQRCVPGVLQPPFRNIDHNVISRAQTRVFHIPAWNPTLNSVRMISTKDPHEANYHGPDSHDLHRNALPINANTR